MHLSENIGVRLQEERKRLGLNQEQMAEKLCISKRTQAGYEAGTSDPSAFYLNRAAAELGFDVLYIVTGERTAVRIHSLASGETEIIEHYRAIPEADQQAIHRIIGAMAELAHQKK